MKRNRENNNKKLLGKNTITLGLWYAVVRKMQNARANREWNSAA